MSPGLKLSLLVGACLIIAIIWWIDTANRP